MLILIVFCISELFSAYLDCVAYHVCFVLIGIVSLLIGVGFCAHFDCFCLSELLSAYLGCFCLSDLFCAYRNRFCAYRSWFLCLF